MNIATVPRRELSDAGALVLKLYALAVMVVDHVDWFLLDGAAGFHATWGRTVFPLFAFLLAANLARTDDAAPVARKLVLRLLAFGAIAHPVYTLLQGQALPLNIMATLAGAVAVVWLIERGHGLTALALFVVAGAFVDYLWLGLAAVVVPWCALRRGVGVLGGLSLSAVLLAVWAGSLWPLVALPVAGLALMVEGDAPRWKWLFYGAYPAHLAVLAVVASW